MTKNQSGFGVVEALLAMVIISCIGGAGWYILQANDKELNQQNLARPTQARQEIQEPDTSQKNTTLKKDYTLFENSDLSIQYPKEWTQYQEDESPEWFLFKSPDFIAPSQDGPGPTAESGYLLEVRISQSESWESYEEDLENAPISLQNHGGTYEKITIDRHNAILSDIKTHGTYWNATAYNNNKTYYFRLNAPDEDKPEVKELFKSLLETVKLK